MKKNNINLNENSSFVLERIINNKSKILSLSIESRDNLSSGFFINNLLLSNSNQLFGFCINNFFRQSIIKKSFSFGLRLLDAQDSNLDIINFGGSI